MEPNTYGDVAVVGETEMDVCRRWPFDGTPVSLSRASDS